MTIKTIIRCCCTCIVAATMYACSPSNTANDINENLNSAFDMVQSGKYTQALDIANTLSTSSDSAVMSASQYCRLALLFATIADNITDNESAMASAVSSLNHAMAINADSVALFVNSLDVESTAQFHTTLQLVHGANVDISQYTDGEDFIIPDHDIDPTVADTLHAHE